MGWGVTTQEVETTTGQSVSSTNLAMAENSVEIYVNRTPSASANMRAADLHWIQTAIKWQAAWLKDQPDFAARQSVTETAQEGVSASFTNAASINLAPLAQRALMNLSWKAGRTLTVPSDRVHLAAVDPREEVSDSYTRWIYP